MTSLKSFRLLSLFTAFLLSLQPAGFTQDASVAAAPAMNAMAKDSMPQPLSRESLSQKSDLQDHRAVVVNYEGDVRILKQDSDNWQSVSKKMVIEEGDQVLTGADSFLEVAYDSNFLNIARIEEKTKAEFRSIEPTDVYMEDGTVFSALDGLAGASYQISTPTAVAGVRGTTFDVRFDSQTGALDMNVYKDLSSHQGIVDVQAGGNLITVTEGNAWDHETQSIVEVSPQDAAKAQSFLENIENQFDGNRSEEILKMNADENAAAQNETGDDRKAVNNPNDGGDQGGDLGDQGAGSDNSGDLNRTADASALDAFVDALIPPADSMPGQESGPGSDLTRSGKDKDSEEDSEKGGSAGSGSAPAKSDAPGSSTSGGKVDYGKAMEFLSIGGMGSEETGGRDSAHLGEFATNIMNNFVDPQSAKMFGGFVEGYEKLGGGFQEFMAGSPTSNMSETSMPMLDPKFGRMDAGMFEKAMDGFITGTMDPNNMDMGFTDFARIVTENGIDNLKGPELTPFDITNGNPFFFRVLHALQEYLSISQKALITPGNEWNVSIVPAPGIDLDANTEKIENVIYFRNAQNQINASYEKIADASVDGGGTIQPDVPGTVYVIQNIDILACDGTGEAGCS